MVLLPERVILIDSYIPDPTNNCRNILFTTNLPFNVFDQFAYEELCNYMKVTAAKHDISVASRFVLQSYNFMKSEAMEGYFAKLEKSFFFNNLSLGKFNQYSIHGTSLGSPSSYFISKVQEKVEHWDQHFDDKHFDRFIDSIRSNLTQPCQLLMNEYGVLELVPTVTVLSSMHGRDRTSQVAASYMMKYMQYSFPQVSALNYEADNMHAPIQFNNQRTINWYCYYLQFVQHYNPETLQCSKEENMDSEHTGKPLMYHWNQNIANHPDWMQISNVRPSLGGLGALFFVVGLISVLTFAIRCWRRRL